MAAVLVGCIHLRHPAVVLWRCIYACIESETMHITAGGTTLWRCIYTCIEGVTLITSMSVMILYWCKNQLLITMFNAALHITFQIAEILLRHQVPSGATCPFPLQQSKSCRYLPLLQRQPAMHPRGLPDNQSSFESRSFWTSRA